MATNLTAAYLACDLWNDVFLHNEKATSRAKLMPSIVGLCRSLQASCLVRVGRDSEALLAYDQALAVETDENNRNKLFLGKAHSLQRLLRYEQAMEQFRQCQSDEGVLGAAACALRLGNVSKAQTILYPTCDKKSTATNQTNSTVRQEILALSALLDIASAGRRELVNAEKSMQSLRDAVNVSPLYQWVYSRLLCSSCMQKYEVPLDELMSLPDIHRRRFEFVRVNIGPLDDPNLLQMDDKVLLHRLLTASPEIRNQTQSFWPAGWVLKKGSVPRQKSSNMAANEIELPSGKFILKERAGYGSHGNVIVDSWQQAVEDAAAAFPLSSASDNHQDELLVQRLILPALLLRGRRFSLRVYAVLIGRRQSRVSSRSDDSSYPAAYISNQGLVKLAAVPMNETCLREGSETSARLYMTNSGRGNTMQQETLDYLRQELMILNHSISSNGQSYSFDGIWQAIVEASRCTLQIYFQRQHENDRLADLGIPKILGLDFMVDADHQPWLLEVNRFPGLEPRESADSAVKGTVLRDAWDMACKLADIDDDHESSHCWEWLRTDLKCFDGLPKQTSLERLNLHSALASFEGKTHQPSGR